MKNQIKKIITVALTATLAFSMVACGKAQAASSASDTSATVIKVGANITPHSEILEQAKPLLAEKGITLEIVQLEDSITPNTGVIE